MNDCVPSHMHTAITARLQRVHFSVVGGIFGFNFISWSAVYMNWTTHWNHILTFGAFYSMWSLNVFIGAFAQKNGQIFKSDIHVDQIDWSHQWSTHCFVLFDTCACMPTKWRIHMTHKTIFCDTSTTNRTFLLYFEITIAPNANGQIGRSTSTLWMRLHKSALILLNFIVSIWAIIFACMRFSP